MKTYPTMQLACRSLRNLSEAEHAARAQRFREDRPFLESMVRQMNSAMHAAIDQQYRIYSLAGSPSIPLMWSHYAEKHTGVCLEFRVDDRFFGAALEVQYRDRYPSLSLFQQGRAQLLPLLIKSADWAYETEYRMIVPERGYEVRGMPFVVDNHLIAFPPPVLKSIIVGCQMPIKDRDQLRALVAQSPSQIELKQMIRLEDRYGLRVEPL
jgi:Protein of unknown function (DUF2971)